MQRNICHCPLLCLDLDHFIYSERKEHPMIKARINPGDLVFLRKQSEAKDGEKL